MSSVAVEFHNEVDDGFTVWCFAVTEKEKDKKGNGLLEEQGQKLDI